MLRTVFLTLLSVNLLAIYALLWGIDPPRGIDLTIPEPKRAIEQPTLDYYGSVVGLAAQDWDPLKKPAGWHKLTSDLKAAAQRCKWREAENLSETMQRLLPKEIPEEYPWDLDARDQWTAATIDLKLYDLNFAGAENEYKRMLAAAPVPEMFNRNSGRAHAGYGLARALESQGKYKEAIAAWKQADLEYWSGCGNCEEGKAASAYLRNLIWTRAQLPYKKAYVEVMHVLKGSFPIYKMELARNEGVWERDSVKPEAALTLGQLCLRNGDRAKALKLFRYAVSVADKQDAIGLIAWTYCQRIH